MSELPTRTADLQAIADAALGGPWELLPNGKDVVGPRGEDGGAPVVGSGTMHPNATYIATFDPVLVSKLLAVVKAAEDMVDNAGYDWSAPGEVPQRFLVRIEDALAALHDTEVTA